MRIKVAFKMMDEQVEMWIRANINATAKELEDKLSKMFRTECKLIGYSFKIK